MSDTIPTPDPIAYGPTGYRCGCGKDAHSNLTPCTPDEPTEHKAIPVWSGPADCVERECDEYFDEDGNDKPDVQTCSHIREEQVCETCSTESDAEDGFYATTVTWPCKHAKVALIGSITISTASVELDNGENLRSLNVGDTVDLRPGTTHGGFWIVAAFHGTDRDRITLQNAEVVTNCTGDVACKSSGRPHAHPFDLDGNIRAIPAA